MTPTPGASGRGACPRVDVVVATHRADRPVERAARSVLSGTPDAVRVLVVAHDLPLDAVHARLADLPADQRGRVTVLRHDDGLASAAGPMNAGLRASDAELVGLLGSDDWYEPGAVAAWAALAADADAVLARVRAQGGRLVRTPPTRGGRRTRGLDLAADRLAYRTAPVGLLRRDAVHRLGAWLTEGLEVGDDLEAGLRLWSGGRVVYAADAPSYVMGEDATVRTTTSPRPVSRELECCERLVAGDWFAALGPRARLAVAVKLVRIHVFGALANRAALTAWPDGDRADLARAAAAVVGAVPGVRDRLSLAEDAALAACLDPRVPDTDLAARARARARHGHPRTLLTTSPRHVLDPQGPGRLMVASALMR